MAIIKALDSPELRELLPQLTKGLYESLDQRTALEYIEIFLKYLVKSTEVVDKQDYAKALGKLPEGGNKIMTTLAEEWKQEGREEILQKKDQWVSEGEVKSAQEMLIDYIQDAFGLPPQTLIEKVKSINSYDVLRGLFKQARKVNTLEEFTQELDKVL
ncbi:hypothetical protein AKJ60_01140 [candidate division MSBL1 archaeon SCGC-AAA385M11]|nr:hypothetical protein AKJ60_01140 [candidate division MSBL1 archaeon SCGC-AAA385M11]